MKNCSCLLAIFALSGITVHAAAEEPLSKGHAGHMAAETSASHASHAAPAARDTAVPVHAPTKRWATDMALRKGMGQVQAALKQLRPPELGHMPLPAAREQAAQIETAIHFLFANCRLEPDADSALHQILLPLLQAAQRLQGDPADRAALAALQEAVTLYPRLFDDPGWPAAPDPAAQ
ncbi:MAG: DnrO protein [Rhodanobacteraceae bacterium]|nr:DnrO protein [Rhodanobacteraceae bacterium]